MSAFTDRLYHQWRNQQRNFGLLLTTGRPATLSKTKFQKAESRSAATPRPPVHNPIKKGSNHGIQQV